MKVEKRQEKMEVSNRMLLLFPALILIGCLSILSASAQSVRGQQLFGDLDAPSRRGSSLTDSRLLDWQVERLINRALEDGLRKRSLAAAAAENLANQQAANRLSMQRLLDTIPRPAQRSANTNINTNWAPSSVQMSSFSERRSLQPGNQMMPGAPKVQMGALDTLDQLSAILDGDNLSRLGRAFKPRTMSTARGFGKRSDIAPNLAAD